MKIAYIILAHTAPNHLLRLVNKLNHKDDSFYIHIDSKKEISDFKDLFKQNYSNVIFVNKRVNGRWGDIGIVQATINTMKVIIESNTSFDQVVLLSGQDYPIKSTKTIRQFFSENKERSFISFEKLPVSKLNYGGKDRTECYSFNLRNRRETHIPFSWKPKFSFKGKVLNGILRMVVLFKTQRKFPFEWNAYYGSQWWSFSIDATQFVVDFIEENKSYLDYHHHSLLPDEFFFQSILLNSYPNQELIVNDNKRFIDFTANSSHPKTLNCDDINLLLESDDLFARKFEAESEVLNMLDAKL